MPAMDFFPAAPTEIGARLVFGETPLTGDIYDRLRGHRASDDGPRAHSVQLAEVVAESVTVGQTLQLALDPDNLAIVDPRTGAGPSLPGVGS